MGCGGNWRMGLVKFQGANWSQNRGLQKCRGLWVINGDQWLIIGNIIYIYIYYIYIYIRETMHYPLVMTNITMERSTMFHGKIHYFYIFLWPFSIAMLVYQRVTNHHFPINSYNVPLEMAISIFGGCTWFSDTSKVRFVFFTRDIPLDSGRGHPIGWFTEVVGHRQS